MKFLQFKEESLILIISDLHLGAGAIVNGRKNLLEDFYADREFIDFLQYYSQEKYEDKNVELIINGDFLDFLAVPFVEFFDDEYWTEKAALAKIEMICKAHKKVFEELGAFLERDNKRLVYILGNHDAEMLFPEVTSYFYQQFPEKVRANIVIKRDGGDYYPAPGVKVKHGHEYELPHSYDPVASVSTGQQGHMELRIPWGFLYVTRVVNRFKEERPFIDSIRPIKTFIIYGLIFDTLFTLRFIFANIFYFFAVILGNVLRTQEALTFSKFISSVNSELKLFQDYEELTLDEFEKDNQLKVLIMGHTHVPAYRNFVDDAVFINTGSWVEMFHFDLTRKQAGRVFTYAQVEVAYDRKGSVQKLDSYLYVWKGRNEYPYSHFY